MSGYNFCGSSWKVDLLLQVTPQGLCLRKQHRYSYQIATQLFVTGAAYCDSVVWSPTELHVERILPVADFLFHLEKLKAFYFQHMLPHLVHTRS